MNDGRRFSVKEVDMSIAELDARIDARIGARLDAFAKVLQKQSDQQYDRLEELFKSGFPDGSPIEHRLAHEEMMRLVSARRKFAEELMTHLAKGGVWALMGFLALAAWQWVKTQIH